MREVVLVVDDEACIRSALRRELGAEFEVLLASCYSTALALLTSAEGIVVVVSDFHMGDGPSGLELLDEVRRVSPGCGRVLVSANLSANRALKSGTAHQFIEKPWYSGEILAAVRRHAPSRRAGAVNG